MLVMPMRYEMIEPAADPLPGPIGMPRLFAHAMKWSYSSKFPLRSRKGKVIGLITINELYNDVMGEDAELNRLLPALA